MVISCYDGGVKRKVALIIVFLIAVFGLYWINTADHGVFQSGYRNCTSGLFEAAPLVDPGIATPVREVSGTSREKAPLSIPTDLILGGWLLFWVYWLVSATGSKKSLGSKRRNFVGARIAIFLLALVIVRLTVHHGQTTAAFYRYQHNQALIAVGLACFVLGVALAVWARVHLGRNWGMPMSLKEDPELVTSGPYRYIRHPIYSGFLLAVLGSALASTLTWLIALVLMGAYFIYSAVQEEAIMLHEFPKAYPSYKSKTKMLIPWLF
jgi:protein-S-isoprenylcysteine O-methyltransferase Ste14